MSAKAVVRMPGEGKQVSLAGKPLVFLVTGQDTKHTSMFDWMLPPGFSPAPTFTASRKRCSLCWKANASGTWAGKSIVSEARNVFVHTAGGAAQHRQLQRKAGADDHDGVTSGPRAVLRGAGEIGDKKRASGCRCDRETAFPL